MKATLGSGLDPGEPAVGPPAQAATARPSGRVTAVDWFKGFAIGSMCMLHYATTVLGCFKLDIHSTTLKPFPLLDGFLQLHNGAFFLLSAFGNWFSIRRGMDRAEAKNPGSPDYSPVVKTILVRGALIMGLGMFATFIFNHGIFSTLMGFGGGAGIPDGQWAEQLSNSVSGSWRNALLSPMVTPYIGFSVMIGGLVAFHIEQRCGPETSRRKTQTMAGAWIAVFVIGFCFRKFLDHATSPGVAGQSCRSWNTTELNATGIVLPSRCFITHDPELDFSDTPDWDSPVRPSASLTCNSSVMNAGDLSCPHGQWDDGKWVDTGSVDSFRRAIDAGCLRGYPKSVSDVSFAHMTDLDRGYQCCSTALPEDASTPTAEDKSNPKLQCCQLTPSYGPPHGGGGSLGAGLADRTTALQKFLQLLTWPLVGTYGFFCYGAESIAGYLIAMHVQRDGWTRQLFQAIFSVAFVLMLVAGPADWWLFFQDGNESVQQASPTNRAYIIATELVAFGIICGVIEGRRNNGFYGCCSPCACCGEQGCCGLTKDEKYAGIGGAERFKKTGVYRFYKRFGMISFTIYHTEGCIRDFTSFLLGELGGRAPPFCVGGYSEDSDCYRAAHECDSPQTAETCAQCEAGEQLRPGYDQGITSNIPTGCLYVGFVVAFWGVTLWVWEKHGFVGSFEWGMQKILSVARGAKSDVLSAKTHSDKPFIAGQATAAAANGQEEPTWSDIPFGEMCPCKFCASCGGGGGGESAMQLMDVKEGNMYTQTTT